MKHAILVIILLLIACKSDPVGEDTLDYSGVYHENASAHWTLESFDGATMGNGTRIASEFNVTQNSRNLSIAWKYDYTVVDYYSRDVLINRGRTTFQCELRDIENIRSSNETQQECVVTSLSPLFNMIELDHAGTAEFRFIDGRQDYKRCGKVRLTPQSDLGRGNEVITFTRKPDMSLSMWMSSDYVGTDCEASLSIGF